MSSFSIRSAKREGSHRARIMAAVRHLLRECRYAALHTVFCDLDGKVLTLSGRVPSYFEKQIAQSLILQRLQGFVVLRNQLEVAPAVSTGSAPPIDITHVVRHHVAPLVEA